MAIKVGDRLPAANVLVMGENGSEKVDLGARLRGRKVVIFGLPGAFTGGCTKTHLPSFMRTRPQFESKGVDEVICVAVNDPYVMRAWGEATGADKAGITMMSDPASSFTKAIGMEFSNPDSGFFDRARRFALYAEDGVVMALRTEEKPGACDLTTGESLLAAI